MIQRFGDETDQIYRRLTARAEAAQTRPACSHELAAARVAVFGESLVGNGRGGLRSGKWQQSARSAALPLCSVARERRRRRPSDSRQQGARLLVAAEASPELTRVVIAQASTFEHTGGQLFDARAEHVKQQLRPELDCVLEWFDWWLPMGAAHPRSYCEL